MGCVFGVGIIESADGVVDEGIARGIFGVEGMLGAAGFEAESALAGRGSEFVYGEAVVDMLGVAEAVEAGAGEDEGVGLTFGPLAKAGVDVAAHLDEADVGTEGEDHGLAAWTGGGDGGAGGQHVETPEVFADEGVAGVGAGRNGGEREVRG